MTITYHHDLDQGSEAWLAARLGVLTASQVKLIISTSIYIPCGARVKSGDFCSRSAEDGFKTCKQHRPQDEAAIQKDEEIKFSTNEKTVSHVFDIAAQRITQYIEPQFIGDDMLRGMEDETYARDKYAEKCAPVTECGFITSDKFGFTLGYSPDGLVGDDGLIEVKSRMQKHQLATIAAGEVPAEYMMQLQTGLLITERKWIDFISYCGGMPMWAYRVYPDAVIQSAIIDAATEFEASVRGVIVAYETAISAPGARAYPTERRADFRDMQDGEYA